jgi:hypothetical protein
MDLQASRCNATLSVSIDLIAEGQPVGHGASPSAGWLSFFGNQYLPGPAVADERMASIRMDIIIDHC